MSKKNIFTDFRSLKGQVSFSDGQKPPSSPKTHTHSTIEDKSKDDIIHVGQSVVLMDSDIRGEIISIGRTVMIQSEDGLKIEAAYGEFAVTDQSEISALRDSNVKSSKDRKNIARSAVISSCGKELVVDLHIEAIPGGRSIPKGHQLQFQMDTFRRVIRENISHRGMIISFIHGVGDGILKAAIRKELDEVLPLRCSYSVGDPAVTTVTIR